MRIFRPITIITLILITFFVLHAPKASALSGNEFQANRIIDDSIFYNRAAMNAQEIQNFLNAKVPVCDTNGTQPYAGTTRAIYSAARGYPAPFICLKNYSQAIPAKSADAYCSGAVIAGTKSAAQIIYDVAQACGVSPKVILVLLQKEQSLVTDDWPWSIQYRSATGYGCPDTAACDSTYYGFFNQVYNAARQYQRYVIQSTLFNYASGRTSFVSYQANAPSCGGTNITMQNNATAGLYNYTPYQPNSAALNNLYGTGDSCSAYGNRNFWRMFNDWFGSTRALTWNYQYVSSSINQVWVSPDQSSQDITISLRNLSAKAWYSDTNLPAGEKPTRLSTVGYQNTVFADWTDPAWLGTRNQIRQVEPIVQPGQTATFKFKLRGPLYPAPNSQTLYFVPVVDGIVVMPDIQLSMIVNFVPPTYQLIYRGMPTTILPNETFDTTIIIKNTGSIPWYADGYVPSGKKPFRLSTVGYQETSFADWTDPAWLGTRNQIRQVEPIVYPGQNATFKFKLRGPTAPVSNTLSILPVIDGIIHSNVVMPAHTITTPTPVLSYSFVTSSIPPPLNMSAGTIAPQKVRIILKNTGNTVWKNDSNGIYNKVRLVMVSPNYRNSSFVDTADPTWLTASQIAMTTPVVNPGENGIFEFTWKAPNQPGNYLEFFSLVMDGYKFFPEYGSAVRTIVN